MLTHTNFRINQTFIIIKLSVIYPDSTELIEIEKHEIELKEDIKFHISDRRNSIRIVNNDANHETVGEIIVTDQGRNLHTGAYLSTCKYSIFSHTISHLLNLETSGYLKINLKKYKQDIERGKTAVQKDCYNC